MYVESVSISCSYPTLMSRCDVISDVIIIKSAFLGLISDILSISLVRMTLSKIFQNFQNGHHFLVRANFLTWSCTGSWVLHQDRPCHSLHLEILFDVLAQILRELRLFQYFIYFWPRDLVIWPLTYKIHRVLCWGRLHISTTFGDDW